MGPYLNIGCGLTAPREWANIDSSPTLRISKIPLLGPFLIDLIKGPKWPREVLYGDIVKGLRLKPESCQLIFMSHVLEHLSLHDAHTVLDNVYRYLMPNGVLRLIVPDLGLYAARYVNQLKEGTNGETAVDFVKSTCLGCRNTRRNLYFRLREVFSNSRHQWMWDEPSLLQALSRHGFREIRRSRFGDWSNPLFELVETRERHQDSLCLEAVK